MIVQERHTMTMTVFYPSGAKMWTCPKCARRIIVYNGKVVPLHYGDITAIHSGGLEISIESKPVTVRAVDWLKQAIKGLGS